jgi:hypothetical protein
MKKLYPGSLFLALTLSTLLFLTNCNGIETKDESDTKNGLILEEIDTSFPHFEMIDKPTDLKGKTLSGVFIYDGFEGETSIKEGLKEALDKSKDGIYGRFYRYSAGVSANNRLDMVFYFPKNSNVPNIRYMDKDLIIEFVCEEGNPSKGNRVISIKRGNQ